MYFNEDWKRIFVGRPVLESILEKAYMSCRYEIGLIINTKKDYLFVLDMVKKYGFPDSRDVWAFSTMALANLNDGKNRTSILIMGDLPRETVMGFVKDVGGILLLDTVGS